MPRKSNTVTVKIPKTFDLQVDDYHEFEICKYYLKEATNLNYTYEEFETEDTNPYWATFTLEEK